MNTDYLESFVRVVECQSIAEAARRLALTPGAVAARVNWLEKRLSIELLQRAGQTVRPTAAGLRVYEKARFLVQDIRDIYAVASMESMSGELRLGVFPSAAMTHLPALMETFFDRLPELSVRVCIDVSAELCRLVETGELDAALVIEQPFSVGKTCDWLTLQEEPLILIVPADLDDGRDAHTLLQEEPFVRYARAAYSGKLVDRYLKSNRLLPRQRMEVDSLLTIVSLVENGIGVALVPDSFSIWYQAPRLRRMALPARTPLRGIGLIWGAQGPRVPIVKHLVSHARGVFG